MKECDDGFPVETVVYNNEESFSAFRYCRGKLLRIKSRLGFDYYINPASSSNLELGTKSNPFMSLDDAFRELFNEAAPYFWLKNRNAPPTFNIWVADQSIVNVTIHSVDMPLVSLFCNIIIR